MAKEKTTEGRIIEERVELMVDQTAFNVIQNPTKRIAHFLKPSLNLNALPPKPPKIQSFSLLSKPNVLFSCSSNPLKGWETWVEKLRVTHEPEWRKAGIFDAIKGSTYHIARVSDLIYNLVERWCPETNTFVFPWGEATVTLEDVYVLGGFSPLGDSVLSKSSLGKNVEFVVNELVKIYLKLVKFDHNLSHLRWQEHFIKGSSRCSNQIENAGFLVLWLTRHVYAGKSATVVTQAVFSMAARLSCGDKLAFGPVILASIYNDLTLLKRKIAGSLSDRPLMLTSPLHLVQVWAWERFPLLGPVPRIIYYGETRLARWENNERKLYDDIKVCLDSSRETFSWRPYTMSLANWSLPRFYVDSGTYVDVDYHEEWKLFSRCLMAGQLVGLNCVQEYNLIEWLSNSGLIKIFPSPLIDLMLVVNLV
ncbi:serine/threonine-protein phosphatase 7 long form homolog [Silene latifolia]|uniref:serine/threonine-protein phosphatase 7 long form homolog n=1 Tax=Silene latifolia TaxID=37657 RepID=UPI003D784214